MIMTRRRRKQNTVELVDYLGCFLTVKNVSSFSRDTKDTHTHTHTVKKVGKVMREINKEMI